MAVDALASSHPLSSPANEVNTPAQISELFDSITYSKVPPGFLGALRVVELGWEGKHPTGSLITAATLGMLPLVASLAC